MARKGPNVCPRCGERVSAFAAGCAICGAELDPHRADRRPGPLDRLLDRITSRLRNRAGEARTQRARR